jgi:hypothetical protein
MVLDPSDTVTIYSNLYVGGKNDLSGFGVWAFGTLIAPDSATLRIGSSETNRANLVLIGTNGISTGSPYDSYGTLTLTGSFFNAYVREFIVGQDGNISRAYGTLNLTPSNTIIADNVRLGGYRATVTVPPNGLLTIGSTSAVANLYVGYQLGGIVFDHAFLEPTNWNLRAYLKDLYIGYGGGSYGYSDGKLTLDASDFVSVTNNLYVGSSYAGLTNDLVFPGSSALQLGTSPSTRANNLVIGNYFWHGYAYVFQTRGAMSATGDVFEAYLKNVAVGRNEGTGGLTDMGLAVGTLNLAASNTIIADTFTIGEQSTSTGIVNVGAGHIFVLGSPANRTDLRVGYQNWGFSYTHGFLNASNASVQAYLNGLTVGRVANTNSTPETGNGTIDMRYAQPSLLDVSGNVAIASTFWSTGLVYLGSTLADINGSLTVGKSGSSLGMLELANSRCAVSNAVTIDVTGSVTTRVQGVSCGLDLGQGATLTINTGGRLHLVFDRRTQADALHYWGLRWRGDHVSALQSLATAGKITWEATQAGGDVRISYDTVNTYIEMRPPGTLIEVL